MYIQKCLLVLLRIHGDSELCGLCFIDNLFKMKAELHVACYFDIDGFLWLFYVVLTIYIGIFLHFTSFIMSYFTYLFQYHYCIYNLSIRLKYSVNLYTPLLILRI